MMTMKEKKDMDDAFKKAQKPWNKCLQKVEKAKQEYHNSCKTERTAANMERNASADSSLSPDQVIFALFPRFPLPLTIQWEKERWRDGSLSSHETLCSRMLIHLYLILVFVSIKCQFYLIAIQLDVIFKFLSFLLSMNLFLLFFWKTSVCDLKEKVLQKKVVD